MDIEPPWQHQHYNITSAQDLERAKSYNWMHWHAIKYSNMAPRLSPSDGYDGEWEHNKYSGSCEVATTTIGPDMHIDRQSQEAERHPYIPITSQNHPCLSGSGTEIISIQETLNILTMLQTDEPSPAPSTYGDSEDKKPANRTEGNVDSDLSSADDAEDYEFLQIKMPNAPRGLCTFAYDQALRNRIKAPRLDKGGDYDTRKYTPTFVHDCLMLPGTLASLIGKRSSADIIRRTTPALLPGFAVHVHATTHEPILLQSPIPTTHVQGMLLLGQGRPARDLIHAHYREHSRRVKMQVEIDLLSPNPENNQWVLFRKKVWANAWVWADVRNLDVEAEGGSGEGGLRWTLEAYLAGTLIPTRKLRIVPPGFLGEGWDEEREVGDDGRETIYGGHGIMDYKRSEAAADWW